MSKWIFDDRQKALEDSFFRKKEEELLKKLQQESVGEEHVKKLQEASGFKNRSLLTELVKLGLRAETFAAISLVPLVEVAWADKKMEAKEKEAILKGAVNSGLLSGSPAYLLLESWLQEPPSAKLFEAWSESVLGLKENMDQKEFDLLKEEILGRAQMVAETSGGFLGMGSISQEEKSKLQELRSVFDQPVK